MSRLMRNGLDRRALIPPSTCEMFAATHLVGFGAGDSATLRIEFTANTNDVNVYSVAGSPAERVDVVVKIGSGVLIGSTNTATAALTIGGFTAGSTITITNAGTIEAKGGVGGAGGVDVSGGPVLGANGTAGGTALEASGFALIIDNGSGNIWAGGGGGAGGQSGNGESGVYYPFSYSPGAPGGQGGGGAGNQVGTGANNGTSTTGGAGGSTASGGGGLSEAGGNGGACGVAGANTAGRTGGAAGKAINLSGGSATFTAGNNAAQVKGAVS